MEIDHNNLDDFKSVIFNYIRACSGLDIDETCASSFTIEQSADNKALVIQWSLVEKVISREDSQGNPFIQVNLLEDKKLLLTDTLVGFKPMPHPGLDMNKIPKVVTTPDLIGVIEAIEDSLSLNVSTEEMDSLRKLFHAVIDGAEHVGFDLKAEKMWLHQISLNGTKATA